LIHSLLAGAGDRTVAHVRAERKLVILDKVCLYLASLFADRALVQVVNHWPFTRQAQFRFKASLCEFGGGQSDAGTGFSLRTLLLPSHYQCHGCVSATHCSLAVCTVPAVMQLYNNAMTQLHQLRRGTLTAHTKFTEEKIMDMQFAIPPCFLIYLFFESTIHFWNLCHNKF
jgi:hypothetical protein